MTTSRETHTRHSTQVLGAIGLAIIAVLSAFLVATYLKVFTSTVPVTLTADRAGLLLDKGARVRLSGVPVGEVRDVTGRTDGTVLVKLALDADTANIVPANVGATIRGTTVFGAKFVDLRIPDDAPSAQAIAANSVIRTDGVTLEVNDVFAHGIKVLKAVDPAEINSTLTAASTALSGRGERFGEWFARWDHYLRQVNPHLPELETDLRRAPRVLRTYADVAPDLIATGDNFARTSKTLDSESDEYHDLLKDTVKGADSAGGLLKALEQPLVAFNAQWIPITRLGSRYSPEFGCVIDGLYETVKLLDTFWGHDNPREHYFYAKTGFLPGQDIYTLAENRPKLATGVGPKCYPYASAEVPTPRRIDFDDGTAGIYDFVEEGGGGAPPLDPVKIYWDAFDDWFGADLPTSAGGGN